jgi:protein O-mannosyl-transferase
VLAILLPLTALALSPVLFADFIRLDDHSHLFDNPHLRRLSVSGLAMCWVKSYFNLYIPVTYSVWWAITMIGSLFGPPRESPWLFHALNLSVHLANAALVFFLVRALLGLGRQKTATDDGSGSTTTALISALVFSLHPAQVETVAWVSELKGGLSTMFGLLGLLWHYRTSKRVLTTAFFLAAMLAKPSAIIFPGIVLLLNRILLGMSMGKSIRLPALYGLFLLPLVFVTKSLQSDAELDFVPTALQRFSVAADALGFYIFKVLVPFPLALDYGRSPQYALEHVPGWWRVLSALELLAGLGLVARALIRPRVSVSTTGGSALLPCGWAIFLSSIGPVLGFIPFGFQQFSTVADHYLYVPLLGVSLMVAGVLARSSHIPKSRFIAVAVLVCLGVLSFQQARLWRSTESLFVHTLKVNPRSYLGCNAIADEHLHAGRYDEAIGWAAKSLSIDPDYLNARITLGLATSQNGDMKGAMAQYESALARNPSTVGNRARLVSSLHNNLGLLLLQDGREADAVAHFRKAVETFPRSLNAHLNLGNIAFGQGRYPEAIAEYETARALNPGSAAIEQRLERAREAARHTAVDGKGQPPPSP